jgi:hypothetical protein
MLLRDDIIPEEIENGSFQSMIYRLIINSRYYKNA